MVSKSCNKRQCHIVAPVPAPQRLVAETVRILLARTIPLQVVSEQSKGCLATGTGVDEVVQCDWISTISTNASGCTVLGRSSVLERVAGDQAAFTLR